ncbi:hypothetical protein [Bordetella sp. LUAb4]|uniref:hypothetical protein n=1 Tax=Bordetella sp. LUAb4 TaxID=2843195 RepID=UPI001E512B3E|nr:hypothetical protein [Bordetella sp. LUAb4]
MALDRVSHFSNAANMSFSAFAVCPAPSSEAVIKKLAERSLERPIRVNCAEVSTLNAVSSVNPEERPGLVCSYVRGGSLLSMSAAHVNRFNAEVTNRLNKLKPWVRSGIDDLFLDLEKWSVDEIQIQGHVRGSRVVADRLADMVKQYLVERGLKPCAVRSISGALEVSTLGFTVFVFGRPK